LSTSLSRWDSTGEFASPPMHRTCRPSNERTAPVRCGQGFRPTHPVVEDEIPCRLCGTTRTEGFAGSVAADGHTALTRFREQPSLVILT
jgi:hypothetical protein